MILAHPAMTEREVDALASRLDLIPMRYYEAGAVKILLVRRPEPRRTAESMATLWIWERRTEQ